MQVKVSFLLVPLHEISAMDITCKIILGDYDQRGTHVRTFPRCVNILKQTQGELAITCHRDGENLKFY